jgi:hypothetical protein
MNPQDAYSLPPEPAADNPLSTMQNGEQVICEIKRHPIGIIGMYVVVGFLVFIVGILAFIVLPSVLSSYSSGQMALVGMLIFVVAAVIGTTFLFIVHTVYWGNRWIVTSDSITQIKRTSLFDKQTSQLSLGNLEDITAEQDGMAAQMFHYGVISAETAAATDKFTFTYCPNPSYYAKQILAARERFEQGHRQAPDNTQAPAPPAVTA